MLDKIIRVKLQPQKKKLYNIEAKVLREIYSRLVPKNKNIEFEMKGEIIRKM